MAQPTGPTSGDTTRETVTQSRAGVDVANHWESIPQFGDRASLACWKRGNPEF